MNLIRLILEILGLGCFLMAAMGVMRPNLVAMGLFLWLLATMVGR